VSIFTVLESDPLLLELSVAVQLTLLVPWLETERLPLALVVPKPVTPLKVAPEQVSVATATLSVAVTVPVTGEVTNQPFLPSGVGKATLTLGGVVSAAAKFAVIVPLP
jgi:hypothetical protein